MDDVVRLTDAGMEAHPAFDREASRRALRHGDPVAAAALLAGGMLRRAGPGEQVNPSRTLTVRLSDGAVEAGGRPCGHLLAMTGDDPSAPEAVLRVAPRRPGMVFDALREGLGMPVGEAAAIAGGEGADLRLDVRGRVALRVAVAMAAGGENFAAARGRRRDGRRVAAADVAGLAYLGPERGTGRSADGGAAELVARIAAADGGPLRADGRVPLWVDRADLAAATGAAGSEAGPHAAAFARLLHAVSTETATGADGRPLAAPTERRGADAVAALAEGFGSGRERKVLVERGALEDLGAEALSTLARTAERRAGARLARRDAAKPGPVRAAEAARRRRSGISL